MAKSGTGGCRDQANFGVWTMRAFGVLVAKDFVLQWPFRNSAHQWNVVFDSMGKRLPFMGIESGPGVFNKNDWKKGKVYRYTYSLQKQSLFYQNVSNEPIPSVFRDPHFKDVSHEYFDTVNIHLTLSPCFVKRNFAYLCVFDNHRWTPIQWGKVENNGTVEFKGMEKGIAYLAMYYIDVDYKEASQPFVLTITAQIQFLQAQNDNKQKLVVKRKYPISDDKIRWMKRMVGGCFEVSNDSLFKNNVLVASISNIPQLSEA